MGGLPPGAVSPCRVQRREGARADDAVNLQPVGALEGLDRLLGAAAVLAVNFTCVELEVCQRLLHLDHRVAPVAGVDGGARDGGQGLHIAFAAALVERPALKQQLLGGGIGDAGPFQLVLGLKIAHCLVGTAAIFAVDGQIVEAQFLQRLLQGFDAKTLAARGQEGVTGGQLRVRHAGCGGCRAQEGGHHIALSAFIFHNLIVALSPRDQHRVPLADHRQDGGI